MGFYDNYKARVQLTLSDAEYINADNKQYVIDNFENQPNYYLIMKNSDAVTTYKVLIVEENKKDNIVGYKKLISYPYTTTQFALGDYIVWGSDTWLLTTLDEQYDYSVGGKIIKTNAYLKWRDENNVLKSYACIKSNRATSTDLSSGQDIVLPQGNIVVQVQDNIYTAAIPDGKRFIIDGKAYVVQYSHLIDGLLEVYLESTAISDYDDLVNDIAYDTLQTYTLIIDQTDFNQTVGYSSTLSATVKLNGTIVSENVMWSTSDATKVSITSGGTITCLAEGSCTITCSMADNPLITDTVTITVVAATTPVSEIRISPAITEILQGDTVVYAVYAYENDVQQADMFTITTSGVATAKYECTVIGGNSFSIKNVEQDDNVLVVRCTNDVDATYKEISIVLGGLW